MSINPQKMTQTVRHENCANIGGHGTLYITHNQPCSLQVRKDGPEKRERGEKLF